MSLNEKQEKFACRVVENGGDKVEAYKYAGYSLNLNPNAMGVQADKLYNHPKIHLRIKELQSIADEVAKKEFTITIEQRLKWLNEVANAGLGKIFDQAGNERRDNLTATVSAIKTMNEMLGDNAPIKTENTHKVDSSLAERLTGGSKR